MRTVRILDDPACKSHLTERLSRRSTVKQCARRRRAACAKSSRHRRLLISCSMTNTDVEAIRAVIREELADVRAESRALSTRLNAQCDAEPSAAGRRHTARVEHAASCVQRLCEGRVITPGLTRHKPSRQISPLRLPRSPARGTPE